MTTRYVYRAADRHPLFAKTRQEGKQFFWETWKDGEWISGRDGTCPLYNLPEVLKAVESGTRIWLVEGEKDADRLTLMGEVATTTPDGAGDWKPEYAQALTGARDVRIIADRDPMGWEHAETAYNSLRSRVRPSLRVYEAALDVPKADVSDHLDAGMSLDELAEIEQDTVPGLYPRPEFPVAAIGGPLKKFIEWAVRDGLHPEAAGAAGLAAIASLCGRAKVTEPYPTTSALWLLVVGPQSSGKSPAERHAFEIIKGANRAVMDEYLTARARHLADRKNVPKPAPPRFITTGNQTLEALIRIMAGNGECAAVVVDELDSFLSGIGQYAGNRKGGDSERAWLRAMWSGTELLYTRVGSGGPENDTNILLSQPVLTVFGPLLPGEHWKLGKTTNGDSARWLPAYLPPDVPRQLRDRPEPKPSAWTGLITTLIDRRWHARSWKLAGESARIHREAAGRWADRYDDAPGDYVRAALTKAGEQSLRLALVLAESNAPGRGGEIPPAVMTSAVALMDYFLDVWAHMPTEMSAVGDWQHEQVAYKVLHWLERRKTRDSLGRRSATRRDIQMAKVCGVKTADEAEQLVRAFGKLFPDAVEVEVVRGREVKRIRYPGD